jgi:hypothetical protein
VIHYLFDRTGGEVGLLLPKRIPRAKGALVTKELQTQPGFNNKKDYKMERKAKHP